MKSGKAGSWRRGRKWGYDAEMFPFLINALLLRRPANHPGRDGSDASVLEQWASVGRATLGDHPDGRDE